MCNAPISQSTVGAALGAFSTDRCAHKIYPHVAAEGKLTSLRRPDKLKIVCSDAVGYVSQRAPHGAVSHGANVAGVELDCSTFWGSANVITVVQFDCAMPRPAALRHALSLVPVHME